MSKSFALLNKQKSASLEIVPIFSADRMISWCPKKIGSTIIYKKSEM